MYIDLVDADDDKGKGKAVQPPGPASCTCHEPMEGHGSRLAHAVACAGVRRAWSTPWRAASTGHVRRSLRAYGYGGYGPPPGYGPLPYYDVPPAATHPSA